MSNVDNNYAPKIHRQVAKKPVKQPPAVTQDTLFGNPVGATKESCAPTAAKPTANTAQSKPAFGQSIFNFFSNADVNNAEYMKTHGTGDDSFAMEDINERTKKRGAQVTYFKSAKIEADNAAKSKSAKTDDANPTKSAKVDAAKPQSAKVDTPKPKSTKTNDANPTKSAKVDAPKAQSANEFNDFTTSKENYDNFTKDESKNPTFVYGLKPSKDENVGEQLKKFGKDYTKLYDADGNGSIDEKEFEKKALANNEKMFKKPPTDEVKKEMSVIDAKAFKNIDINGDGKVDTKEMTSLIALMDAQDGDKNIDGKISYSSFAKFSASIGSPQHNDLKDTLKKYQDMIFAPDSKPKKS